MAVGYTQGFVEVGGQTVSTDGRTSTTRVQRSFPGATVTVYLAGTLTLATIYSDAVLTPKANPFTADQNSYWGFFADEGSYDIKFSGAGISTPFSLLNWRILATAGIPDPGSNGLLARTALNTVVARTIQGTTSEIAVTNGDGVAGNPVVALTSFLEFTGKTLNGGTYISPGIANFQSAQHDHDDASGGGQLNATNVFSTGTVPVARLPLMTGATGIANGVAGLVPAPLIADVGNFLRGDGTWATAGGGGGGTPGGGAGQLQYNNAGAFGGVSGGTSDGTNVTFTSGTLRATSPRVTTSILDANGNAIVALSPVASAVNQVTVANAATGGAPAISATGSDSNINIVLTPKGTGINFTTGNIQVSNNAPQMVLTDVNDSKQVRVALNGSNWQFINDTAGQTPINIDTTNSDLTTVGNLFLAKASAITIGRPSQTDLSLSNTTGVFTFGQIPVLPASDPTTDNQAVRKVYVDTRRTNWSASWFINDPSTFPLNSFSLAQKAYIPTGTFTTTQVKAQYSTGTASGSFTVEVRYHPANDQTTQTTLATVTVNSGTVGGLITVDINPDVAISDVFIYIILTARSSPLQRDFSVSLVGYQTLT